MTTKKKSGKASKKVSPRAAIAKATSKKATKAERIKAFTQAPLAACDSDENLQKVLNVLRDKNEQVEVRLAAMQSLAAAAFSSIAFEPCRNDYIAALREVSEDADPEIRQRALGLLMREQDGFAEQKLLAGLKDPDQALVSPEKALQLLSYDVHAEAYAVARKIVSDPPNDDAKREALRLLAADASSAPLFEKVLRDKDELAENRQIAASALSALNPEKFQANAREILLDKSEHEDIQATSLTALANFADQAEVEKDQPLMKSIDRLSSKAKSGKYKQSARRFLSRHGR